MLTDVKGKDVKAWRERTGLTQKEAAEALGVTEMTIYRWEQNISPVSKANEIAMGAIEKERATSK
jgi:DNA-binding transcriptional regulator YiaG